MLGTLFTQWLIALLCMKVTITVRENYPIEESFSHVRVRVLDFTVRVEPVFALPRRVPERGLAFLEDAEPATGISAAATIIPIEMEACTSSSWIWNCM